jgi:hypothetical protein
MLCIIFCFACQQKTVKVEEEPKSDAELVQEVKSRLLKEAMEKDSVDTHDETFFFRFRSGHIFSDTVKNAVYFGPLNDSTTVFELYTLKKGKWVKNDTIQNLIHGLWGTLRFLDYNFDGQKDIRYVHTVSNGAARSYGHVIIVHPKTKQLKELKHLRNFGDIWPEEEKQVVESSKGGDCPHRGNMHSRTNCIITHKWIKDSLILVKKDCSCYD